MALNLNQIKYLAFSIILFSLFSRTISVLSFTYPQSTTLKNKNILVVEKNGFYICDPSFNNINTILYEFSEEDKINTETKLSTTIIQKSSFLILILANYKIYIFYTQTGELLYHSSDKLITGDTPEYVSITYSYTDETKFYFTIAYLDSNNYLKLTYYQYIKSTSNFITYNSISLNSIEKSIDGIYYTFYFQNKGLSCENIKDYSTSSTTYITCFIIGNNGENDYLITVSIKDTNTAISFISEFYKIQEIKVNNNKIIKVNTNSYMDTSYVCYVTEENIGTCYKFRLYSSYHESYFFTPPTIYSKKCRAVSYGMKVNYIFETEDVLFTCSDLDGSLQVQIFGNDKIYLKYENCTNIYGFSIIYLKDSSKYYVTSDVNCKQGIIPYDILINSGNYTPEIIPVYTTNQVINIDSTEIIAPGVSTINKETMLPVYSTEIKNVMSSILNDRITEKLEIKTTEKIEDNLGTTNKISEDISEDINDCPEMCLECNSNKECTKCNPTKNYYPIELTSEFSSSETVECLTISDQKEKFPNFYLDPDSLSFKPCYEYCSTCYGKGDGNNNNCSSCEPGYVPHPDYDNSTDCVPKPNSLFYIKFGQYTTTNSETCPEEFSFLVEKKNKCIEECKKDNKYKYTYDGNCYETPPENTNDDDGDFLCKDNDNKCIVTKKRLITLNDTITDEEINSFIVKYAKEFNYTNNHISVYENNIYIITIYKNGECLSDLGISSKVIDFGDCYTELQEENQLNSDQNLIVANIETKPGKESYKKIPKYSLYHPSSGTSLNYEEKCKDKKITIQTNLTEEFNNNSKVSLDDVITMAEQGIDLFDKSSPFYSDLCTHYPDILGKDIPLKKRILAYYPDIQLCDDYCELSGIFLKNLSAKCECKISEEERKGNRIKDNAIYQNELGNLEEFIYLTNINVIKCYKDLFAYKYFINSHGGFIILGLMLILIICSIIYFTKSKFYTKKYIFSITNKYLNYLKEKDPFNVENQKNFLGKQNLDIAKIAAPPRRINKSSNAVDIYIKNPNQKNNDDLISNENNINQKNLKSIDLIAKNSNNKINISKMQKKRLSIQNKTFKKSLNSSNNNHKLSFELSASDNLMNGITNDFDIYIEDFLKTDPQDMDYDEALRRDKRTFCRYYYEKIQTEQMILNTFFNHEPLKPKPIKIMLFILQIELYLFVNGLFYNEEYVTKLFELEKDTIPNKIWRFLDNLFYAFLVGVIINYIIEFFFIEEKKLRVTLKREKDNILILKYEMIQIIKDIEKRYLSFIIISFIISVFIWYHLSCFNNIYPHMQEEWIIFSILIISCVQILSLVTSLIETILRFLSFRFKNEKIFKLSLIFS